MSGGERKRERESVRCEVGGERPTLKLNYRIQGGDLTVYKKREEGERGVKKKKNRSGVGGSELYQAWMKGERGVER